MEQSSTENYTFFFHFFFCLRYKRSNLNMKLSITNVKHDNSTFSLVRWNVSNFSLYLLHKNKRTSIDSKIVLFFFDYAKNAVNTFFPLTAF